MAAPDVFTVEIQGKGGHAARPEETIDPIAIGTDYYKSTTYRIKKYKCFYAKGCFSYNFMGNG